MAMPRISRPRNELALYIPMASWLKSYLESRHRGATIEILDTFRGGLKSQITAKNYGYLFSPEWNHWEIEVDLTGLIIQDGKAQLAFIEAKDEELKLMHLSQLVGYSRVARPLYSFLLAPQGYSGSLAALLVTYARTDLLVYHQEKGQQDRRIVVAQWDASLNNINHSTVIK
jgi:hypothetical protein